LLPTGRSCGFRVDRRSDQLGSPRRPPDPRAASPRDVAYSKSATAQSSGPLVRPPALDTQSVFGEHAPIVSPRAVADYRRAHKSGSGEHGREFRMRGFAASVASLGAALLFAVPAAGFGPNANTSSTTTDPAVIACAGPAAEYTSGVVASQTERGVQAGGVRSRSRPPPPTVITTGRLPKARKVRASLAMVGPRRLLPARRRSQATS